ncbi:MAG: tRNA preQ1(34) S-adenosylmethionine ribosyltransferase-isomerase QueA [Deltaproteobacteria bacterium]|nr:tRNA preQ1(34) S-adenosylmethionine ribosyltransferase-isomerase QueA [Deltaproteobacteria bacterium]
MRRTRRRRAPCCAPSCGSPPAVNEPGEQAAAPGGKETAPFPADFDLDDFLADFDFELPPERIAQHPLAERDAARMLVVDRSAPGHRFSHARVSELADWLRPGDLLVVNATRVVPARLRGYRESGGRVEALLLAPCQEGGGQHFRALVKLSGRLRPGIRLRFERAGLPSVTAEVSALAEHGEVVLAFEPGTSPYSVGEPPLPPYIRRGPGGQGEKGVHGDVGETLAEDFERYQTVYARVPGAVAAPTAGLHLTPALLDALSEAGVERAELILHVGAGTFRPLHAENFASGRLHSERYELPEATVLAVDRTRARGGRVVAVGTTTARVLEACAAARAEAQPSATAGHSALLPGVGETDLFLWPGSKFHVVDVMLTNFHLPRSSLLLLVAALAGRERILAAYREALEQDYRFFSYGDAMLIL